MTQVKRSKFSSFQNVLLSSLSQLREKQTIEEVKTINAFRFVAVKLSVGNGFTVGGARKCDSEASILLEENSERGVRRVFRLSAELYAFQ